MGRLLGQCSGHGENGESVLAMEKMVRGAFLLPEIF